MKLAEWATAVKERDHHTCARCGYTGKVVAHHIQSRREGGLNELANGMTLCFSCHSKLHQPATFPDVVHTRLSVGDVRQLDALAIERGITRSDIMRALIKKWLRNEVRLDNGDYRDE